MKILLRLCSRNVLPFKIQSGKSTYMSKDLKTFFGYNFHLKILMQNFTT